MKHLTKALLFVGVLAMIPLAGFTFAPKAEEVKMDKGGVSFSVGYGRRPYRYRPYRPYRYYRPYYGYDPYYGRPGGVVFVVK